MNLISKKLTCFIMNCQFCLGTFDNNILLSKHLKSNKTNCKKYRKVIFTCSHCNFSTFGLQNIEKHNCNLVNDDSNNKHLLLQNQNLHLLLEIEKTKKLVYQKIIEKNLNLKLDIDNKTIENQLLYLNSIYNISNSDICKRDESNNTNNTNTTVENEEKSNRNYKTMKKYMELIEEPESISSQINYTEPVSIDSDELVANFEEIFSSIRNSRVFTKYLSTLKSTRISLFGKTKLDNYISMINKHINTLKIILSEKSIEDKKKIIIYITSSLSSIEQKLIFFGAYYKSTTNDIDEMEKYMLSLRLSSTNNLTYFSPFNINDSLKFICNYSSCLFPLNTLFTNIIVNTSGFFNIIYIKKDDKDNSDPYSFYILDKVVPVTNNTKIYRYWNMDCRLENLSINLIRSIKPSLINLFRKIYFDVFHDNDFRSDYKTKSPIFEMDCEQLLQNIFLLINSKVLSFVLRDIIKSNSTYQPSLFDKFNITADDIIQKKRFESSKDYSDDIIDVCKSLFDEITSEQSINLYGKIIYH